MKLLDLFWKLTSSPYGPISRGIGGGVSCPRWVGSFRKARNETAATDIPERYNDNDSAPTLLADLPTYEKQLGEFYTQVMALTSRG